MFLYFWVLEIFGSSLALLIHEIIVREEHIYIYTHIYIYIYTHTHTHSLFLHQQRKRLRPAAMKDEAVTATSSVGEEVEQWYFIPVCVW